MLKSAHYILLLAFYVQALLAQSKGYSTKLLQKFKDRNHYTEYLGHSIWHPPIQNLYKLKTSVSKKANALKRRAD
jgi:hypothetical protein